jgi:hypothetical protein
MFGIAREAWKGKKAEPRTDLAGNDRLFIQILFPSLAASATELSDADAWPKRVEITTEKPSRKFLTSVSRVMNERGGIAYFIKSVRDATDERIKHVAFPIIADTTQELADMYEEVTTDMPVPTETGTGVVEMMTGDAATGSVLIVATGDVVTGTTITVITPAVPAITGPVMIGG